MSEDFRSLDKVDLSSEPPGFGSHVYNIGHPLGTPKKISFRSHVLRYTLFSDDKDTFCHRIDVQGSYSTDLDQFPGMSDSEHSKVVLTARQEIREVQ